MGTRSASPFTGASVLQRGSPLEEAIGAVILFAWPGRIRERHPHARAELRLPGVGFSLLARDHLPTA